jgi:hypothetical protein
MMDSNGVSGGTCAHGIAVLGSFTDMPKPECFSYYILQLFSLLAKMPHVKFVFVDFACKLRVSWQRFLEKQCGPGGILACDPELAAHLQKVELLVNWMHAEGHSLDCQLEYSGRHTPGTGRRHGEATEQLWALVKVCSCCWWAVLRDNVYDRCVMVLERIH